MLTRVERLKKRKAKLATNVVKAAEAGKTKKVSRAIARRTRKAPKLDEKIAKTKARVAKREAKPKRRVVTKGKTNSGAKVKTVVVKKKDGTVKRTRSVVSGKGIKRGVTDSRRPNKGLGKMKRQARRTYRKTGTLPSY